MLINIFNSSVFLSSINKINNISEHYFNNSRLIDLLMLNTVGYLRNLQSGITFQDLQNFMFILTFLRFCLYSLFYNIKTGFYIACISFVAALIWYFHLVETIKNYNYLGFSNNVTTKLITSYKKQSDLYSTLNISERLDQILLRLSGNFENSYRIDPISMIFTIIPEPLKDYSNRVYYTLWDNVGPSIVLFLKRQVFVNKMTFLYLAIARHGKKHCPYLVRWHWTYAMIYTLLTPFFVNIPFKLDAFAELILLPQMRIEEYYFAKVIVGTSVAVHVICILLPLFHALLGQYFYVPFITENVEIHIGKRPQESIYSGGYTAWQDSNIFLNVKDIGKHKNTIRLWWGWFGRGNKPVPSKRRQKKRRKLFKTLRKFFENFFGVFK